ncbi:hypothetical protein [Clostridium puniceum]|uniref:hypothetical protein n=1 Tax=Clostridium puniceum TaxID=29367 RepID=UPI003BFA6796
MTNADGTVKLVDSNGQTLIAWQEVDGKWYYLYSNGVMAYNTYVRKYYVGIDGEWHNN